MAGTSGPRYTKDSRDKALDLLMKVGEERALAMVVIGRDQAVLYASEGFRGFVERPGKAILIRRLEQISAYVPDPEVLETIWRTGEPCSMRILVPLVDGPVPMTCDCIPFIDEWKRVGLVTLVYSRCLPEETGRRNRMSRSPG